MFRAVLLDASPEDAGSSFITFRARSGSDGIAFGREGSCHKRCSTPVGKTYRSTLNFGSGQFN
jgi:hypothetical protein